MARPRSPDHGERRAAILAAAARLYARQGFAGASLSDLAAACGASKSRLYHYFPSKEAVLHAVMDAHLALLAEAAEAAVAAPDRAPRARLEALATAFLRLYAGAADSHRVLLGELGSLPAPQRADIVAKQRRILDIVAREIARLDPTGDPRVTAMLFFGMLNWTPSWFRPDGPATPDALAARAVHILIDGIGRGA